MSNELELAYRIRRALDQGTEELDPATTARLQKSRLAALDHLRQPVREMRAVGATGTSGFHFAQARGLLAAMALLVGAMGTYYWNTLEQAAEHAAVDSELLADEVPFDAYLDQGFMEWLDRLAQDEKSDEAEALPSE